MISRSGIHTLRALAILAKLGSGECVGAGAIAREIGAPENYLSKLLQAMVGGGVIVSRKGFGGGFRLARPAKEITLFQALDPAEDFSRFSNCLLGYEECSDTSPCPLHGRWGAVRDRYFELLNKTTIADLVGAAPHSTEWLGLSPEGTAGSEQRAADKLNEVDE